VSVARTAEVLPALAGGPGILDVKDPPTGSLGAADPAVVRAARRAAPEHVAVSAALGDRLLAAAAADACTGDAGAGITSTWALGCKLARAGAGLLKVGLADATPDAAVAALRRLGEALAREGSGGAASLLVAVGFADGGVAPFRLPAVAAEAGVAGAMLDTLAKGPSIVELLGEKPLADWVADVHARGLLAGIAGSLRLEDLGRVAALGPDVVGVRGAVCHGGRNGRVSAELVRRARAQLASGKREKLDRREHEELPGGASPVPQPA
jgi:uncharacterized protein (UPF0264 family)